MKVEQLHIGMTVRHPQYGVGVVKGISEKSAEVHFDDGKRTIDPEMSEIRPDHPQADLSGLKMPLEQLIGQTVDAVIHKLGLEKPESEPEDLARRWHQGRLVLEPRDASQQKKELPLETFFHKIVLVRNNLRVLEQKLNNHSKLEDAEKVDLQQYITRSYGSLTTFNVLFKHKEDQF